MKKYLAVFLIIVTIVSLASCTGLFPKPSGTSAPSDAPSPATAEPSPPASPSPPQSATALFLTGEPTASDISKYLSYNASHFSQEDGDLLLERLLLLQLDIALDMNSRILDEPYLAALNDTLGGILDAAKIPEIKDETIRAYFQLVSDSMMTMVRYEETPVFEPDWAALEAMKQSFSAQAGVMTLYQSRLQGRYYFGDPYNFDQMAADIIAVEEALDSTDSGFVRWQLKYVYNVQVGRLLYGPEGSFLGMFMSGDKQVVSNIEKYAKEYTGSRFGTVCKNLLAMRGDGEQAVTNFISDSLMFPPGDSRGMTRVITKENGAQIEIPLLAGMQDAAVMEKVNAAILDAARALVKSDRDNQTVRGYISFVNDTYISLTFLYSYKNESDTDNYSESYLMLDLKTGVNVTLDDLVGKPFGSYKDQLLQSISGSNAPKDLKEPVHFVIGRDEMIISVPSATSVWPDNYAITWNGLRSFMDISKFY